MALESVEKCLSVKARKPGTKEWKFHSNSYDLLGRFLKIHFGSFKTWTTGEYILRSQAIQAEVMRYIYDELRSRKFECSGVLLWTYTDAFTKHGWSLVDYYLRKKPVYYYLRRACAPLAISWQGYRPQRLNHLETYKSYYANGAEPIEAIVSNDTLDEKEVELKYRVMSMAGKVLKRGSARETVPANGTCRALSIDIHKAIGRTSPENVVVAAELFEQGMMRAESRYFLTPFKTLKLTSAVVSCRIRMVNKGACELTLSSKNFVWMFHIAEIDGLTLSDNDFDLIPGRPRVVTAKVPCASAFIPQCSCLNPRLRVKTSRAPAKRRRAKPAA